MSVKTAHWSRIPESTFMGGIRFMHWLHRWLGRTPFRLCLYPVVFYYYLTQQRARRASMQYLQRCQTTTGALGAAPTFRHGMHHFVVFAETILDKILAITGSYPASQVEYEGRECILPSLAKNEGGVIVTAHMGCLELLRVLSEQRTSMRLNILVHTQHAQRINKFMQELHPSTTVKLLEVTDMSPHTAILLGRAVAAGEFVVIAGDRVPVVGEKTVQAAFLGHPAPFPVGPYVLASLLKCPLFMVGCLHRGQGYVVIYEKLADQVLLPRQTREEAMRTYAGQYAGRLQAWASRAPYDWFNFFMFWEQA